MVLGYDAPGQTGGPLTRQEHGWADGILSPRPEEKGARK